MRSAIVFFLLVWFSSFRLGATTVRIEVAVVPQLTPLLDTLYLCGTLNNWDYADRSYAFRKEPNGRFVLDLKLQKFTKVTFLVTRGNEATTEEVSDSLQKSLRSIEGESVDTLRLSVEAWMDIPRCEGLSPNVRLLDANFRSKQFPNPRRIWLYLPSNWNESSQKLDVLLMNDGQNLFSSTTSFAGEWHLDENLDELAHSRCASLAVVGIDNAGMSRLDEYTPYRNDTHGGGDGDRYLSFLVDELLPQLRVVLPLAEGPEHTFIGGSSLGGLISLYALMRAPGTFGGGLIFSPSLWFSRKEFLEDAQQWLSANQRIYFACGASESASLVNEIEEFRNVLKINDWTEESIPFVVDPDGQHNERSWDAQTYKALLFLMNCNDYETVEEEGSSILMYPNPADDFVVVALSDKLPIQRVLLRDANGKEVAVALGMAEKRVKLNIGNLIPNSYTLVVESVSGEVYSTILLVQ